MYFETFTGKDGQYYFNLRTSDKVIMKSEGYSSASGRNNGIDSVKKNAMREDLYHADDNNFNLKSTNGQVIATSTIFSSVEALEEAMQMVMAEAVDAEVKERV